jgi:hypothetical protein
MISGESGDGPLEENDATFGASISFPVTVRAGSIFATGELLAKQTKKFSVYHRDMIDRTQIECTYLLAIQYFSISVAVSKSTRTQAMPWQIVPVKISVVY